MNKPIISTYEVKLTCDDILAEVHYAFWKGMPSGDYDVPNDSDEVEISRILINNVDMSNVLFAYICFRAFRFELFFPYWCFPTF